MPMTIPQFTAQFALESAPRLRTYYCLSESSIFKGVKAMEQSEITSQSEAQSQDANHVSALPASIKHPSESVLIPQQTSRLSDQPPAQAMGAMSSPFVYALGRIEPRFPSLSVEKEFAQAIGRSETVNLTDRQALSGVLSRPENRYLIRQLCWVLSIAGMETYLLQPRDPADFDLLVEAVNPDRNLDDIDVVIGIRGPIAPPEMCNGLMVPIVAFDQIYSFTREAFIQAVPAGKISKEQDKQFRSTVKEVFDQNMQMADNAGAMDEHRAVNYLTVRYPTIYARAAESHQQNASLSGIQVRPSSLSSTRKIMDVIFSYTNRQTNVVDMFAVRVDVTEEFPFLVSPLSPYYER
jgi:PatG C-terminal